MNWYIGELKELRNMIITMGELQKAGLYNDDVELKSLKGRYRDDIRKAKADSYSKFIDSATNKTKTVWKLIDAV